MNSELTSDSGSHCYDARIRRVTRVADVVEDDERLIAHQDAHALEDLKLARAEERFGGVGVVPLRRTMNRF